MTDVQIEDLPPEPAGAEVASDGTSLLYVTGPMWVTSYTCKTSAGDTLVVTQSGVRVPSEAVAALIAEAASNGVHLSQGK